MKHRFYTLIATTILAGFALAATPAAAQWNGMDHSGSSYSEAHANRVEEHHEMHKDHHAKHEHHHAHKHHHHHKHHDGDKH